MPRVELAERLRQLVIEDGGYATRAKRYVVLLSQARDLLSEEIQRRLRTLVTPTPD